MSRTCADTSGLIPHERGGTRGGAGKVGASSVIVTRLSTQAEHLTGEGQMSGSLGSVLV